MGPDFIKKDDLTEMQQNPWVENFFRPALLVGMITCLSVAIVNLIQTFNPSWHRTYILAGMILVTIEAVYSYRILKIQGRIRDINWSFRLGEWGSLMLVLKALTYVNEPWRATVTDIQNWATEPMGIFTMEYSIVITLSFLIWYATTNTMKIFDALFDLFANQSDAGDPFSNLTNRFYYGGGLLIFISGVTHWISREGLGVLTDFSRPRVKGVFFNALIYFVLGLILLSQTQLNIHYAKWQLQKIDVSATLIKRWALYGTTVLVIVGGAVFFLPTSYTMGFLSSAKLMLQYGINAVLYLAQIAWTIIYFPFKWLMMSPPPLDSIIYQKEAAKDRPIFSPEYDISAPASDVVQSFIFWIVFLAVVVFILRTYLKDHPEILKWLRNLRLHYSWFTWLARIWQWLKGSAQAVIELMPKPVILHTGEPDTATERNRRWFRLGKMSARKRIIYYYLSTLRRAQKAGINRHTSQTPTEFAPRLAKILPDKNAEINQLTETFVHARYSRDTFIHTQAHSIKRLWKNIRIALKRVEK